MTIGNANRHAESRDLVFLCGGKTPESSPTALTCFNPSEPATHVARAPPPAKAWIAKANVGTAAPGCPAEQSSAEDAMNRLKRGTKKFHNISSRCHPEQSEGSMHSACSTSEWPTLQRFSPVILSAAATSRSEAAAESKDPYPSAAAPERQGILTVRPPALLRLGSRAGPGTR
jgi:hypothetical protein